MKLLDINDDPIVDIQFYNAEYTWVTYEIPDGKEIIGLQANINYNTHWIYKLGFLLWTPNPNAY